MPRTNRGYKKGEPYRDARMIVIACEGMREKAYFQMLIGQSQRLNVEMLAPEGAEEGFSHPSQVIARAELFIEEYGLKGEDDSVWLIMDVDRWKEHLLYEIIKTCENREKWNITISNPCFEVWLYFHLDINERLETTICKEIKNLLHEKVIGGYKVEVFTKKAFEAAQKAKDFDNYITDNFPKVGISKIYNLVKYLEPFISLE